MEWIKKLIAAIAGSKKAVATLAGVVLSLAAPLARKIGWELTQAEVEWTLIMLASFIVGQGIADAGKEKAKIEAANAAALNGSSN